MDWLDELKGWGWLIVLLLGALYMALRDKLGLDFVRRREWKDMRHDVDGIEKLTLGAHEKLGEMARRQDSLEGRVETIDTHGSTPTRELREQWALIREDMREIKTHLKYLRSQTGKD